jgi:hypothetical protein
VLLSRGSSKPGDANSRILSGLRHCPPTYSSLVVRQGQRMVQFGHSSATVWTATSFGKWLHKWIYIINFRSIQNFFAPSRRRHQFLWITWDKNALVLLWVMTGRSRFPRFPQQCNQADVELPSWKPVILTAISATPNLDSYTIHFTLKTYKEETEGKGTEPKTRGLNLILHSRNCKWHIKLTFQGKHQSAQSRTFTKVTKRRKDLENLFLYIDLDPIQLLTNTVTELLLTRQ